MKRLKQKWGIESNIQLGIILVVFSLAGSLTVFVRRPLFSVLGLDEHSSFWIKFVVYLLSVPPTHFSLLLIIGTLFGQFQFFWNFEKRLFSRFKKRD